MPAFDSVHAECTVVLFTAFLSADGKTKVNMFFRANDYIQLTKLKIKVFVSHLCSITHCRVRHYNTKTM